MRDPIENISKLQKQLIARLKAADEVENYDPEQGKRIIHPDEITDEMANNFFARFWGRQDVYAKRNENKDTGKAGYYTQCRNFWTSACHRKLKTGVSCKNCEYYECKPLTKEDILAHLRCEVLNKYGL